MKTFNRICYGIVMFCWGTLCILAKLGIINIDAVDYCVATGVLTITYLTKLIKGD